MSVPFLLPLRCLAFQELLLMQSTGLLVLALGGWPGVMGSVHHVSVGSWLALACALLPEYALHGPGPDGLHCNLPLPSTLLDPAERCECFALCSVLVT